MLKDIREQCKKEILERLVEDKYIGANFIVAEALNKAFDKVAKAVENYEV